MLTKIYHERYRRASGRAFEEMKARYKKDDESLPYFFNEYWYIVRYEEGKNTHFLQKI
jgi:protease II